MTKVVMVVAAPAIKGLGSLTLANWGCPTKLPCSVLVKGTLLLNIFMLGCMPGGKLGGVSILRFFTSKQTGVPITGALFRFGEVGWLSL